MASVETGGYPSSVARARRLILKPHTVFALGMVIAVGSLIDSALFIRDSGIHADFLYPYPDSQAVVEAATQERIIINREVERIILENGDQVIIPLTYRDRLRTAKEIIDRHAGVSSQRNEFIRDAAEKRKAGGFPPIPPMDRLIPIGFGGLAIAFLGLGMQRSSRRS